MAMSCGAAWWASRSISPSSVVISVVSCWYRVARDLSASLLAASIPAI